MSPVRERARNAAGDRLLAERLHVERRLALPLGSEHPPVELADEQHVAQAVDQRRGLECGVPGPDRPAVVVEHPDEPGGEVTHRLGRLVDLGPARLTRAGEGLVAEVGVVAGAPRGLGDHQSRPPCLTGGHAGPVMRVVLRSAGSCTDRHTIA